MLNFSYYQFLKEIDVSFFDLERSSFFLFRTCSDGVVHSDNNDFYLCVRKKFNDFFFDCIPKGILISKDYNLTNKEVLLNQKYDFFSKKLIKVFPREFFKRGTDPFKSFFYFVPKFGCFYDVLKHFSDVDYYKSSRLFLVERDWASVKGRINFNFFHQNLHSVFYLQGFDFQFSIQSEAQELNFRKKVYEIFFEDLYFFGPFKSFDKSLIFIVRYNIDLLSFKDNIIIK